MNNEISFKTSSREYRAFFQNGFYSPSLPPTDRLHVHNYAEIHLVVGGNADFLVGEKTYCIENCGMLLIPQNTFHCCTKIDGGTLHTAFQISCGVHRVAVRNVGAELIYAFIGEVNALDYSRISAYVTLFCAYFDLLEEVRPQKTTDYGFLIREFLSNNYSKDLRLSDLAAALHLSERQTERLVIKHTGTTFRRALAQTRISMAKALLQISPLPLNEIARYVGYRSYSGFWKALSGRD